jgi:hypothetical protein
MNTGAIWRDVESYIIEHKLAIERKNDALVLAKVSLLDMGWLDMIPGDWQDIYGALYDDATNKSEADVIERNNEVYAAEETIIPNFDRDDGTEKDDDEGGMGQQRSQDRSQIKSQNQVLPEGATLYQRLHASPAKKKIAKDVHRTFSIFTQYECSKYTLGGAYEEHEERFRRALMDVLLAASETVYERGYCQGLNFIAGNFLLSFWLQGKAAGDAGEGDDDEARWHRCERRAFIALCFLLRHSWLYILFDSRCSSLMEYMCLFQKKLRRHNSRIYKHWKAIGFDPLCATVEWFTTCFITVAPGSLANCTLDLLFGGCEDPLLKVGLALVDELEDRVLVMDLELMHSGFKGMVREVDPVRVLARALTLDSKTFFPDTSMLLTMVRNIEEMRPPGEGEGNKDEYVYTSRPVPPTVLANNNKPKGRRSSVVVKGMKKRGTEEEEEGDDDDEEEEEDEEDEKRDTETEGEEEEGLANFGSNSTNKGQNRGIGRLYYRNLGAAALQDRLSAVLAGGMVSSFALENHLGKLMAQHYTPPVYAAPAADSTTSITTATGAGSSMNTTAIEQHHQQSGRPRLHGGMSGRGGGSCMAAATAGGTPTLAQQQDQYAQQQQEGDKEERRRLRIHYRRLLHRLAELGDGPDQAGSVTAAQEARQRVMHINGHLYPAGGDSGRLRSPLLLRLGAFRGLDKTIYWKDSPRKRGWAARVFSSSKRGIARTTTTTSTTFSDNVTDRGSGSGRLSRLSLAVDLNINDRSGSGSSKVSAGPTMNYSRRERETLVALREAEKAYYAATSSTIVSVVVDDSHLALGWRDVRLPANRARLSKISAGATPVGITEESDNNVEEELAGEQEQQEKKRKGQKKKGLSDRKSDNKSGISKSRKGRGTRRVSDAGEMSSDGLVAALEREEEQQQYMVRCRVRRREIVATKRLEGSSRDSNTVREKERKAKQEQERKIIAAKLKEEEEEKQRQQQRQQQQQQKEVEEGVWGWVSTLTLGLVPATTPSSEQPAQQEQEQAAVAVAREVTMGAGRVVGAAWATYLADDELSCAEAGSE